MLVKAIQKYGKDYERISNALKTKTTYQVQNKIGMILRQVASDPKHEHAKHAKILKKISLNVYHVWTDKQNKKFTVALQKYGKDYTKILKYFPALSIEQIWSKVANLKQSNTDNQDSRLKKILEKRPNTQFSKKEEATFVKMVEKYGPDYKRITAKLRTKTLQQVRCFAYRQYKKIEKDPKLKHSWLLKKKLKLSYKIVPWTLKE